MSSCDFPHTGFSSFTRNHQSSQHGGMSGKGWVAVERAMGDMGSESDDSVYYDLDSPKPSPDFSYFEAIKGGNKREMEKAMERLTINGNRVDEVEEEEEEEQEMILLDKECYKSNDRKTGRVNGRMDAEENGEEDDDEEDEEEEERGAIRVRLKRCSSLKMTKTEEGDGSSSGEKKIVRFADALGLDLADVRTFMDEVPRVPRSAFSDLEGIEVMPSPPGMPPFIRPQPPPVPGPLFGSPRPPPVVQAINRTIVPLFLQPSASPDFLDRLQQYKICLESALISDPNLFTVQGIVRVVNLDFHKSVIVRHTRDGWRSHSDLRANYVDGSCDGFSDRFRFALFAHTLAVGDRLEFALRFDVHGTHYWDNNRGANYAFQCVPDVSPPRPVLSAYLPSDHTWGASLFF